MYATSEESRNKGSEKVTEEDFQKAFQNTEGSTRRKQIPRSNVKKMFVGKRKLEEQIPKPGYNYNHHVAKMNKNIRLRELFAMHLKTYNNENAKFFQSEDIKGKELNFSWKTKRGKKECGVYMLIHMELYGGSPASKWKTGFLNEGDQGHMNQIDSMRTRIAAKLLLHDENIHRKKMSDYAIKMENN